MLAVFAVSCARPADAAIFNSGMGECKECHSKNPKVVSMHRALEFKTCAACHGQRKLGPKADRHRQKKADQRCVPCHNPAPK